MTASEAEPARKDEATALYLDLLKGCLTRDLFPEQEVIDITWWREGDFYDTPEAVWEVLRPHGWRLVRRPDRRTDQRHGLAFPLHAETMVGRDRLDNVQSIVETVLDEAIGGDIVETGVWRGGTVIFMRALLKAYGVLDRTVWVCDSFQGLPEPDPTRYPHDETMQIDDAGTRSMFDGLLSVPADTVRANFARYGLLDDQVRFLEGWFSDTLPDAPIEQIAVLRLDGDLYESTMDALVNLEPRVAPGGFVVVDDYGSIGACQQAVTDYREQHGIDDEIHIVDWTGAYWRKGGA